MNILGLNYFYHDSTACIVKDGQLIVALEEERLTRQKHTCMFPQQAILRCLEVSGLKAKDIDHIAISVNPKLDYYKKAAYALKLGRKVKPFIGFEFFAAKSKLKTFNSWLNTTYPDNKKKPTIHFVPHHISHVVGSFFVSPYESAALLGVDGSGEWATTFKGIGKANTFQCLAQDYFPMSLGSVYEAATEFCGFKANYDEGKTMGLAPLGNPETFGKVVSKLFWINEDMSIGVDLSYFNYQYYSRRCGKKFYETFGQPREQKKDAVFEQRHLDVAAAFQKQLEECILKIARQLHERTHEDYLVVSGGVALNSVANGRLVRESGFKDLYVMPAAGDNGTAIGAAFYVCNSILGQPRAFVHDNPYVGTKYANSSVLKFLEEFKLDFQYVPDGKLEMMTAELLNRGFIVGWFQGQMEIGPRSLGNRSILANPTLPDMKDRINTQVKHREAFRPFAPSCPIEDTPRFFEQNVADPFMLKVCRVLQDKQALLPAITHVDGTARLQTVHQETNSRYHKLLKEFERLSGVPVLLNTSFNVMGEPIVESPVDAIRCFYSTGIDYLVLENYVISKKMGINRKD